ncbi:MAG TPA: hypothetical protein VF171_00490, partial [Trueperaceae bacterium]
MRVTFLSNGHGEDAIGALLAREFHAQCPTLALRAFPTVDEGGAYERAGVPVLGPRRVMPSGGFLFHSAELFLADLRAGFLPMTLQQLRSLRQLDTDMLIVIGDVVALAMSALVRSPARYYVQPLVSVHHATPAAHRPNRLFMERFTGIERALIRRLVKHTYVRDAPTATHLHALGLRQVSSLGNPMLAAHDPHARLPELGLRRPVVGMLPGTRRHAAASLTVMLQALASWPQAHGVVAWAGGMLPPLEVAGWCPQDAPEV